MQVQIEMMQQWINHSQALEKERSNRTEELIQLMLTRLSPTEDIEAYLSTFERMMEAFKLKKTVWAYKLAHQLTGKVQQAFAGLDLSKTVDYDEVKSAILQKYDIAKRLTVNIFGQSRN